MSFVPVYKPRSWVPNIQYMDYNAIINNEHAIDDLLNSDMLVINDLSHHPGAIELLERNLDNVNLLELTRNPAAVHIFEKLYLSNKFPIIDMLYIDDYKKHHMMFEMMFYPHYNNIPVQNLYLFNIFQNPSAICFIMKHFKYLLSNDYKPENKTQEYQQRWLLMALCKNPSAIDILLTLDEKYIHFESLMENPQGYIVLEKYPKRHKRLFKIDIGVDLLYYHNEGSLRFVTKHYSERMQMLHFWFNIHYNESDYALELLMKNPDKILWNHLCYNTNPKAIELLRKNKDKIDWKILSCNHGAIELIEEKLMEDDNMDKIHEILDLNRLARNKNIYVLDTKQMNFNINVPMYIGKDNTINGKKHKIYWSFVEELISKVFHPSRVYKHLNQYGYELFDDKYIDDTVF